MSFEERLIRFKNMESEETKEEVARMRVFYVERDFYTNPQVVIIVAKDEVEALELYNQQLESENYPPVKQDTLEELDLSGTGLKILSPPGDRHLIR